MAGQNATTPRWLSASEMKAWRRYIIASRRLLEALDFDIAHHELSMADYEVLAQLSDAPERKMRMSELADVAMISRSRLSHRIKVMEKASVRPATMDSVSTREMRDIASSTRSCSVRRSGCAPHP